MGVAKCRCGADRQHASPTRRRCWCSAHEGGSIPSRVPWAPAMPGAGRKPRLIRSPCATARSPSSSASNRPAAERPGVVRRLPAVSGDAVHRVAPARSTRRHGLRSDMPTGDAIAAAWRDARTRFAFWLHLWLNGRARWTEGCRESSAQRRGRPLESGPCPYREDRRMAAFLLWLLLLVFCWPLALLALVLYPIVWLVLLPFRLVGITVGAVFAFLGALLMLPARVLRGHPV